MSRPRSTFIGRLPGVFPGQLVASPFGRRSASLLLSRGGWAGLACTGWLLGAAPLPAGAQAMSPVVAQAQADVPVQTLVARTAMPVVTTDMASLDYRLQPRALAPGHWVVEGAVDDFGRHNGCNIINTAVVAGSRRTLVINTGPSRLYGKQQREAVARVLGQGGQATAATGWVLNLNLHPDYFFGNQAWTGWSTLALAGSRQGMQAEGAAYADNLYRLCGDWMKGTEATPAQTDVQPGPIDLGGRVVELRRLQGHTADDLVVLDAAAKVAYVGGLVFKDRVPTTPHARMDQWLASLDTLEQWLTEGGYRWVVPSHGPVHEGLAGLNQTRDWLRWLQATMQAGAARGLDLNEMLLDTRVPARFAGWAAMPAELHRSLTQLYPAVEVQTLRR